MKLALKHIGILFLFGLFLASCSIKKFIPEDERLYTGAVLKIEADTAVKKINNLREDLRTVLRPKPNTKFLGMHLGLYYYYKNQQENTNFINKWLFKQLGQNPVYQSDVEELEVEDILHYHKIIVALTETDRIMKEIDKIEIE